jgi:hypothetical protein
MVNIPNIIGVNNSEPIIIMIIVGDCPLIMVNE